MTDPERDHRRPSVARIFSFPNPVNEKAARTVAGGVLLIAVATLVLSLAVDADWLWLSAVLAAGFLARVLAGPRFSPLGRIATQLVAPHLGEPKLVAGPPKRFAQAVGVVVTAAATVATAVGAFGLAQIMLGLIIVAAGLESIFAYCLGCKVFGLLMRVGLVPEETCEACNNVQARIEAATAAR